MAILIVGESVVDYEFSLLKKILTLLDVELSRINAAIGQSSDPESDGLCDVGEFLIGSGFVAIQRYLNATRVDYGVSKKSYDNPPKFNQEISTVRAINAIANYWKHSADWDEKERNGQDAKKTNASASTLKDLERMGELGWYPCADTLASMVPGKDLVLSNLLPTLLAWRGTLGSER